MIWIEGIKAVVFKDLLHFVYTDELLPLDDLRSVRLLVNDRKFSVGNSVFLSHQTSQQ